MAKGRKTTYEERVEIVEYCLKNGKDYTATAAKYEVPYGRVYDWVDKYSKGGVAALRDKRGKGKDIEDMDEKERLAAENRLLRARVGRCLDNAPMEGFWGTLKSEMYYLSKFSTYEELAAAVESYIQFYNPRRYQAKHKSLAPLEVRNQALAA